MQIFEVGKPYEQGVQSLPEGIAFDYTETGGFLRVVFDSPTEEEIQEIKDGKMQFGLLEKEGIIFLLIKFGRMEWMDVPYYIMNSDPYVLGRLADETKGYPLHIVFVDGRTGIVKVIKRIGLPHEMSIRFKEMVENQRRNPIENYEALVKEVCSEYSTDELVDEAEIYQL